MCRPISWGLLLAGDGLISSRRAGGRVLWLTLCVSFFFLNRVSEKFTESRPPIFEVVLFAAGDEASFPDDFQLAEALWSTANRVEVRFRGSKEDCERVLF